MGLRLYIRYVASFLKNIPNIQQAGDLRPLDKSMGELAKKFHYRGKSFFFDCGYCDHHLQEDSFAFGVAREIYIRDCYFRWIPSEIFSRIRVAVDLGANRGAFSALMTTQAKCIISVECDGKYESIIRHNLQLNNYDAYGIEVAAVGSIPLIGSGAGMTMEDLMRSHQIESIDFLKIDIEGSEFSLFAITGWLDRVHALSMELHPAHGDCSVIAEAIKSKGFELVVANENLERVNEICDASFLYAWKRP